MEQEFRRRTVGLVSADDFRKARSIVQEDTKNEMERQRKEEEKAMQEMRKKERADKRKKITAALSFDIADIEGGGGEQEGNESEFTIQRPAKKIMKDPTVETAYLPDRERDQIIEAEKTKLREEWLKEQELVKNEVSC